MARETGAGEELLPVQIPVDKVMLDGDLAVPKDASGIVIFAHGTGSGRLSPRNRYVAEVLQSQGLATLLFDLLTKEEEAEDIITGRLRFDIRLLADRLGKVTDWVRQNADLKGLKIGYFGASTGAAAALIAAAERPDIIGAVVSRGGRPDLAGPALPLVKAPTLLIVGGADFPVVTINRDALNRLQTEKKIVIVPGATHLFEEPGALEEVARLAADWFVNHLVPAPTRQA